MKKLGILITLLSLCSVLSAYNPPVNGESFFEYSTPKLLSGSTSVAGGGIFSPIAESIIINPAITAAEQRVNLSFAYTGLISGNELSNASPLKPYGNIIQTTILIPSKLYTFTGLVNFTSVNFSEMALGSTLNIKASLSKEITDKLDIGLGLNGGFKFGDFFDWSVSANVGTLISFGDLGFLKDLRVGVSVNNLGKNFTKTDDIRPMSLEDSVSPFPTLCYVRAGIATTFVSTDFVKLGMSLDFDTPLFQNLIITGGINFSVKDQFFVNVQEKINIKELSNSYACFIPSIGISYKFRFNVNNVEYLAKNDWNENEMRVSAAYKNVYETVNAISTDVDITLGLKDETPPEIKLWEE